MGLFGWRSCCLSARLNARLSLGMALKEPGEVPGTRTAVHHINEPLLSKSGFSPADQLRITRQKELGSAAPLAH